VRVVRELGAVEVEPSAVAIGSFDGLHIGHQELIQRTLVEARERGLRPLVVTLDPPSKVVLRGDNLLTTLDEQYPVFEALGVPLLVAIAFTVEFSRTPPVDFAAQVVAAGARLVVVGEDFAFGRGREGRPETLRDQGVEVVVVPTVIADGEPVKSTRIRALLEAGAVADAARLLGRPYVISGVVEMGEGRARRLGWPTANLVVDQRKVLPRGVFAVKVDGPGLAGAPGVLNVGVRPTVGGTRLTSEVHVLDVDRGLYGETLACHLMAKLRDEVKFPSLEALTDQVRRDIELARSLLAAR